jgi:hypothetical protein
MKSISNLILIATSILLASFSNTMQAQQPQPKMPDQNRNNPWAIKDVGTLPPVASLTEGVWLKGDLHVHSSHSTDGGSSSGPDNTFPTSL